MGVYVRELRHKIRMLEAYTCFEALDDIAEFLGRKPGTILSWADGTGTQRPDHVPFKAFPRFLELFEQVLPDYAPQRVKEIVLAPASALEQAFRITPGASLMALIDAEADTNGFRVIRASGKELGLVETSLSEESYEPDVIVSLDEFFRIQLERELAGMALLALQNIQGIWSQIPCSTDLETGYVYIPGKNRDGTLATMRERRDVGLHRFIVLATAAPFPDRISSSRLQQTTIDHAMLSELAAFYSEQPKETRKVFCLKIAIEKTEFSE